MVPGASVPPDADDDILLRELHGAVAGDNNWNPAAREVRERPLWMLYEDQEEHKRVELNSTKQRREQIEVRCTAAAVADLFSCVLSCMRRVGGGCACACACGCRCNRRLPWWCWWCWCVPVCICVHVPQNLALIKVPMRDEQGRAYGTGRRKTASARVWVKPGSGDVTINGQALVDYFPRMSLRTYILEPFVVTHSVGAFDVWLTVSGGGLSGKDACAVSGSGTRLTKP